MDLYDVTYFLSIAAALISMFAQIRIHGVYGKYKRVVGAKGLSGVEAARRILSSAGVKDLTIEETGGVLTDHYDPSSETLRLSKEVYHGKSLSAVGIAAHEAGHAAQHFEGYAPFFARQSFVKTANIGSKISIPFVLIGILLMSVDMAWGFGSLLVTVGLLMFSFVVVLSLITLPVEFNASSRAISMLEAEGILNDEELSHVRKILSAAAWTYVASTIYAVLTLLRLVLMSRGGKGRR